jgi:hypothetical protein
MGPNMFASSAHSSQTLAEKAAAVRSLKGKEKEWVHVAEKKRPLQLRDLPVDILKEIIEKVRSSPFLLCSPHRD